MSTYETTQNLLGVSIQPSVDAVTGIHQGMAAVGGRPRLLSGCSGWNESPTPVQASGERCKARTQFWPPEALTLAHSARPDHWAVSAVSAVSLLTTRITSSRGRRSFMEQTAETRLRVPVSRIPTPTRLVTRYTASDCVPTMCCRSDET